MGMIPIRVDDPQFYVPWSFDGVDPMLPDDPKLPDSP